MPGRVFQHVSKAAGFTLIELITVTVIIGVLMLAMITQMDGLIPQYALRSACRQIGAIMKTARNHAITSGKDVYVEIDLGQGEYWILAPYEKKTESGESPPLGQTAETAKTEPEYEYHKLFDTHLNHGIEFVDVILSADQTYKTGKVTVRVTPFGASMHVIVNLKNLEKSEMAVKLNGFTGGLSYYDKYKEPDELLQDE